MNEHETAFGDNEKSNVQMHEIKPSSESMTFGALLDKFYLTSELGKDMAKAYEQSIETKAQDIISNALKIKK
jgi:hypothetical protein